MIIHSNTYRGDFSYHSQFSGLVFVLAVKKLFNEEPHFLAIQLPGIGLVVDLQQKSPIFTLISKLNYKFLTEKANSIFICRSLVK